MWANLKRQREYCIPEGPNSEGNEAMPEIALSQALIHSCFLAIRLLSAQYVWVKSGYGREPQPEGKQLLRCLQAPLDWYEDRKWNLHRPDATAL